MFESEQFQDHLVKISRMVEGFNRRPENDRFVIDLAFLIVVYMDNFYRDIMDEQLAKADAAGYGRAADKYENRLNVLTRKYVLLNVSKYLNIYIQHNNLIGMIKEVRADTECSLVTAKRLCENIRDHYRNIPEDERADLTDEAIANKIRMAMGDNDAALRALREKLTGSPDPFNQ